MNIVDLFEKGENVLGKKSILDRISLSQEKLLSIWIELSQKLK
jgi:hypothetical protein